MSLNQPPPMSSSSNPPCTLCARKKIKCDRIVPCSYCLKHGLENECEQPGQLSDEGLLEQKYNEQTIIDDDYETYVLQLLHNWEYWVIEQGFFNSILLPSKCYGGPEMVNWTPEVIQLIDHESGTKLLTHSIQNIGCLYLSFFPDVNDLYTTLDIFLPNSTNRPTIDDFMNEALIWSILTTTVFYLDQTDFSDNLFFDCDFDISSKKLYSEFLSYTLELIQKIQHYPDIRLVQMFLILSNTSFRFDFPLLYNNITTNVLQVSQVLNLQTCFRAGSSSSITHSLIKTVSDKLWYKLLFWDYKTESYNRPISLHGTFFNSLLKHAAFLKNQNFDRYTGQDCLELLQWKIVSLERDIDQYQQKKPSLRTIEVIKRELEMLHGKFDFYERLLKPQSTNDEFDHFIMKITYFSVHWKLLKLIVVFYYQDIYSLNELFQYSHILLDLMEKHPRFVRNPIVLPILAQISAFHGFFYVFNKNQDNHVIFKKLRNFLKNENFMTLDNQDERLGKVLARFSEFKNMFKTRDLNKNQLLTSIPIVVLKNDINIVSNQFKNRIPNIINGIGPVIDIAVNDDEMLPSDIKKYVKKEEDNIFKLLTSFEDFI